MKQSQVAISSNVRNFHSDTGEPCLCLLGPWRALAGPGFGMLRPADTRKNASVYTGWPKRLSPGLIAAYQRKNQLYSRHANRAPIVRGETRVEVLYFRQGGLYRVAQKTVPLVPTKNSVIHTAIEFRRSTVVANPKPSLWLCCGESPAAHCMVKL